MDKEQGVPQFIPQPMARRAFVTTLVAGFTLTPRNREDLIEFLKSLTDEELIRDPRFANPWPR